MQVKKYLSASMKDALKMIKEELGPDAVILSARDIKRSNGVVEIEVTAAVSELTLHKKKFTESRMDTNTKERFRNSAARSQKHMIDKVVDRKLTQNKTSQLSKVLGLESEPLRNLKRNVTSVSYIDIPDEEESVREKPTLRAVQARMQEIFDGSIESDSKPMNRFRNAAKEAFTAGRSALNDSSSGAAGKMPEKLPREQIEVLQTEIVRLQSLLNLNVKTHPSVHSHPGADYGIHFELSFMFQKLLDSGVSRDLAAEILNQAQKEMDHTQMKKRPLVDAFVARWFLTHTKIVADPFHGRTHVFVGPAGSGKTSMLVKWASHLILKKKKRVAIVTTDTQKVGAVDQLKIYAQILNVPFVVIRNQNDFSQIPAQFAHVDHFLVDTPGMQLKELSEIDFLRSILPPQEMAAVSHLVLNCIAKDTDCLDNCKRFRLANYQDLIFTNLDQSVQHGVIANVGRALNVPLNSFGIGNSIPEDFEEATKERILDLIFKLTRIQRGVIGHGI